jgi:hypothetical protein
MPRIAELVAWPRMAQRRCKRGWHCRRRKKKRGGEQDKKTINNAVKFKRYEGEWPLPVGRASLQRVRGGCHSGTGTEGEGKNEEVSKTKQKVR